MFIRFDRMYERDRHTDRQTDRHRMTAMAGRAYIASRGKNGYVSVAKMQKPRFSQKLSNLELCVY